MRYMVDAAVRSELCSILDELDGIVYRTELIRGSGLAGKRMRIAMKSVSNMLGTIQEIITEELRYEEK